MGIKLSKREKKNFYNKGFGMTTLYLKGEIHKDDIPSELLQNPFFRNGCVDAISKFYTEDNNDK